MRGMFGRNHSGIEYHEQIHLGCVVLHHFPVKFTFFSILPNNIPTLLLFGVSLSTKGAGWGGLVVGGRVLDWINVLVAPLAPSPFLS